jgi:hypothetical protein
MQKLIRPSPAVSRALAIPVFLFTAVATRTASGLAFAPIEPATCPAWTEVNWKFNMSRYGTGEWMVPADDLNEPLNYANNVDYLFELTANERVNEFYMRFDYFATEPIYDYLAVAGYSPDGNSTNVHFTDTVPWQMGQPVWGGIPTSWQFPRANASVRFHSDASVNYDGIVLGRAAVCTRYPGAALGNYYRDGYAGARFSGVLLGGDDVVYFRFPVGSTKAGDQCSSAHDTFALQGDPNRETLLNDFDLYVRCGSLPTPDTFTARDYNGPGYMPYRPTIWANTGFVHLTTDSCPCGSYWYVAVHSYAGSGWFNLWNYKHYASEHRSSLGVYVQRDLTLAEFNQSYLPEMTDGLAQFFGANEGTRYFDAINIGDQDSTGFSGEVIIYDQAGRPESDKSCDWSCGYFGCGVYLNTVDEGYGTYEASTLSHELGHYYNCLDDEYDDDRGTRCGHSIMGTSWGTNTNYCYCNEANNQSVCPVGSGDHGLDGNTYYNTENWAVWDNLSGRSPIVITRTPDNYDFFGFDFHGQFASPMIFNAGQP